jgi:hypothetical protein
MQWDDKLRFGIHEVGHIGVEYVLTGVARACFVFTEENGSYGAQTDTVAGVTSQSAMGAQDYLHLAAGFLGGWAAVHLAVESGALPRAPASVESVAGDHGYLGSDQIYAHWAAVQADMHDPSAIMMQSRKLALDTLRPRLDEIIELGELAAQSGLVAEHVLIATIAR